MNKSKQAKLETYKKAVRKCLVKYQNCSDEYADELMKLYEDDFEDDLKQYSFTPNEMAFMMVMYF